MWNDDEVKGKTEEVKGKAKQAAGRPYRRRKFAGGRRGAGSRRQGSEWLW